MVFAAWFAADPFDLSDLGAVGINGLFGILAAINLLLKNLILIPAENVFTCAILAVVV